jgi:hypothetical protein
MSCAAEPLDSRVSGWSLRAAGTAPPITPGLGLSGLGRQRAALHASAGAVMWALVASFIKATTDTLTQFGLGRMFRVTRAFARDHGVASIGTPFAETRREGWPWCLTLS